MTAQNSSKEFLVKFKRSSFFSTTYTSEKIAVDLSSGVSVKATGKNIATSTLLFYRIQENGNWSHWLEFKKRTYERNSQQVSFDGAITRRGFEKIQFKSSRKLKTPLLGYIRDTAKKFTLSHK